MCPGRFVRFHHRRSCRPSPLWQRNGSDHHGQLRSIRRPCLLFTPGNVSTRLAGIVGDALRPRVRRESGHVDDLVLEHHKHHTFPHVQCHQKPRKGQRRQVHHGRNVDASLAAVLPPNRQLHPGRAGPNRSPNPWRREITGTITWGKRFQ